MARQPGQKDAPQHKVMGETILKLLDVFQIPHQILDDGENVLLEKINQAKSYLKERKTPYALIIKKGYFDKYHSEGQEADPILAKRADYVELMDQLVSRDDIILGATGYTGREVSQLMEDKVKFYMMGSMGYLSSLGLGLALEHPEKTVYVLDGDGALLMNLGGMSTIGHYHPANIVHVCFNNYEYESTGSQAANSKTVDFLKIAKACQYRDAFNIEKVEELREIIGNIQQYQKPLFIQIRIRSGTFKDLPRPAETAELMVKRFMESLT